MTKCKLAITNPKDIAEILKNLCKNSPNKEEIQLFVEKYKEGGGDVVELFKLQDIRYGATLLSHAGSLNILLSNV